MDKALEKRQVRVSIVWGTVLLEGKGPWEGISPPPWALQWDLQPVHGACCRDSRCHLHRGGCDVAAHPSVQMEQQLSLLHRGKVRTKQLGDLPEVTAEVCASSGSESKLLQAQDLTYKTLLPLIADKQYFGSPPLLVVFNPCFGVLKSFKLIFIAFKWGYYTQKGISMTNFIFENLNVQPALAPLWPEAQGIQNCSREDTHLDTHFWGKGKTPASASH